MENSHINHNKAKTQATEPLDTTEFGRVILNQASNGGWILRDDDNDRDAAFSKTADMLDFLRETLLMPTGQQAERPDYDGVEPRRDPEPFDTRHGSDFQKEIARLQISRNISDEQYDSFSVKYGWPRKCAGISSASLKDLRIMRANGETMAPAANAPSQDMPEGFWDGATRDCRAIHGSTDQASALSGPSDTVVTTFEYGGLTGDQIVKQTVTTTYR